MSREYVLNHSRVRLGLCFPEIDWQEASRCIDALPGVAIIEMHGYPQKVGAIFLGGNAGGKLRPDVGTVLAIGDCAYSGEVFPGDKVLALGDTGKWVEGFRAGDYEARDVVRFLGIASQTPDLRVRTDLEHLIVAVVDESGVKRPVGRNVLIRRPCHVRNLSGIELPESASYRDQTQAEVVMAGPKCSSVQPGDKVVYQAFGLIEMEFEGDDSLAFIHEDNLHAVVRDDEGE